MADERKPAWLVADLAAEREAIQWEAAGCPKVWPPPPVTTTEQSRDTSGPAPQKGAK